LAGRARRTAIIAETADDARGVIVEGPSGFLSVGPPAQRPTFASSKGKGQLTWPNGAVATLYSAMDPEELRGPEFDLAYCDELAKWAFGSVAGKPGDVRRTGAGQRAWDNLQFGLRIGSPRCVITTTPRPLKIIRQLLAAPRTAVTRGTTFDNAANLAPEFIASIRDRYVGTRIGRQELAGEVLEDVPGALWWLSMFDADGFRPAKPPDMARIVVSVDPSGARGADDTGADSIGIVVAGKGVDGRAYVLADRTCRLSPSGWGRRAVEAYHEFRADRIIGERNFGGAMVESTIRNIDPNVSYKEATASSGRGKAIRAEPVAALYEQNRVSHVGSAQDFELLEAQMCAMTTTGFVGEGSPDRVDALVWALDELMGISGPEDYIEYLKGQAVEPATPKPPLPWHEQKDEASEDGGLVDVYARAFGALAKPPPTCARCGKEVGATRISDGVSFWHRECHG
jgi:phage terminase large subunit-like protein